MRRLELCFAVVVLTVGVAAADSPAAGRVTTLAANRQATLTAHLEAEKPTLFLFYRQSSAMERTLMEELRKEFGGKAGLRWVPLTTGGEALARQYQVTETPVALVYDRRKRLVNRTGDPGVMRDAVRKALGVPRIDWAADDDPRMAQVERVLGRRPAGGILRTMSLQPEYLAAINEAARKAHFADGFLDRRTKEMIATHVSAINKCKY